MGEPETLEQLLQRYMAEDTFSFSGTTRLEVNSVGRELETPLHMAVTRGEIEDVQTLLSAGAEVNAKDSIGATPLHRAVCVGDLKIIEVLLKAGASPSEASQFAETAISLAKQFGRTDIHRLLSKYATRST